MAHILEHIEHVKNYDFINEAIKFVNESTTSSKNEITKLKETTILKLKSITYENEIKKILMSYKNELSKLL